MKENLRMERFSLPREGMAIALMEKQMSPIKYNLSPVYRREKKFPSTGRENLPICARRTPVCYRTGKSVQAYFLYRRLLGRQQQQ